ncbi:MAG: hypothetical protein ACD_61C00071G0003 [uncultured bacterium]|nr:MAG: hypothetical protein ACD_61C00071G0003 [uncultured bacterium]
MKKIIRLWPVLVFAVACFVYYWKVFLKGYVPFPGDLMVGAYLPWLENKWGFPTGVPVKNPLISDIFSQFYMWKSLIGEGWRHLTIPLWNPYSYSGYPLLATFHSGVFYPFTFIYALLGDIKGWNFLVIFPSFATALTMYFFLRQIKVGKVGAVVGGLVYAYSGFAISWAQFVTADQAMIWMPLVLIILEKYFESKKKYYLYWLPILFFLLVTAGHFQIMVYITVLSAAYFVWKWIEKRDLKDLAVMIVPGVLTFGLSAFQLLPTLELTKYGLRSVENYIAQYNYGLLPIKYLVTLIAPDYFGNPATGNFFGVFNYHEAIFYTGIFAVFCFLLSLFMYRSNKYIRFFVWVVVFAFLFGFDTFLGKAVYIYNVPGIATSAAGRVAVIFSMGLAVLAGIIISNLEKISYKKILLTIGIVSTIYILLYYLAKFSDGMLLTPDNPNMLLAVRRAVTLRNLLLPGALVGAYSILLLLSRKWRIFSAAIIVLVCLEMFRFGWKYIPFVPERIVYPETPITQYLEEKGRSEVFRIDRERAEVLPPATWMQYRLMSPSGYDPMAIRGYAEIYQKVINGNLSGQVGRYSELERYDSKALGEFNVKYLVVVKRDKVGKLGGDFINFSIDQKEWKKAFETSETAILENTNYRPRARFVDSTDSEAKITSYTPNTIKISFSKGAGKTLLLADTWYPGWKAYVNGSEVVIDKCDGIFRCIKLTDDNGEVIFDYRPASFRIGLMISILSLIGTVIALAVLKKK